MKEKSLIIQDSEVTARKCCAYNLVASWIDIAGIDLGYCSSVT